MIKGGEKELLSLGIDIHKMNGVVAVKDAEGRLVDLFNFSNSKEGIIQLANRIRRFNDQAQAVVESSGNYWISVYEALESEGIRVVLASAIMRSFQGLPRLS